MESILDKRVSKRTRRKKYFEYLVKWKGHPVEDVSWENKAKSRSMDRLCESSWTKVHENFQAREYDAGASRVASTRGGGRQLGQAPTHFNTLSKVF
jgi:hypothetical protein